MTGTEFILWMAGKDNDPEYGQFIKDWHDATVAYIKQLGPNHDWRTGQLLMNALYQVRPDLYHFATGTSFDPFYRDGNLSEFGERIYDQWVKQYVEAG
jgi:hypothetical protein